MVEDGGSMQMIVHSCSSGDGGQWDEEKMKTLFVGCWLTVTGHKDSGSGYSSNEGEDSDSLVSVNHM